MTSYLPYSDDGSKIFLAFERIFPAYHHAKFGCNWTTNKGETEGACDPPAYVVPNDLSLNRVKSTFTFNLTSFRRLILDEYQLISNSLFARTISGLTPRTPV